MMTFMIQFYFEYDYSKINLHARSGLTNTKPNLAHSLLEFQKCQIRIQF